ncbi:MAG TPA: carbohydrate kinase family protein [Vicinamibacteria bacterium]|nr:carbohydrate kinase family protein [Vicinamibacteria bacterium]
MSPDLVVLGNLLVDDVVFPDGRTRFAQPGGACLYLALGAALWGLEVGIVSVIGDEYPAATLEALRTRRVHLQGTRRLGGPGLRTWLLYEGARRRVVHRLEGPSHAEVSPAPADVPEAWRSARAFHLAPMPLEVQALLSDAIGSWTGASLSVDPYELFTPTSLPALEPLLARVDALFLSEDELELGRPGRREDELGGLLRGRLQAIAFKRGARGGVLARAGRFLEWAPRATEVADPTGAGDAFAAGVLAGWLRGEPDERALARGVVTASFAIEAWGADGLLRATPDAAEGRLAEWFPPVDA